MAEKRWPRKGGREKVAEKRWREKRWKSDRYRQCTLLNIRDHSHNIQHVLAHAHAHAHVHVHVHVMHMHMCMHMLSVTL